MCSRNAQHQDSGPREQTGHDPGLVVCDPRDLEEAEGQDAVVFLFIVMVVVLARALHTHARVLHVPSRIIRIIVLLLEAQIGVAQMTHEDQTRHDQRHAQDKSDGHA